MANEPYFSVKDYFEKEAQRLSKKNPTILKIVKRNNEIEQRKVTIENWEKEFDLFIGSDINKPSWHESYEIIKKQDTLIYRSKDPQLKTRQIMLVRNNKRISVISIQNFVKNTLYSSEEKLYYYPDSLYKIEKTQDVLLIGKHSYQVSEYFSEKSF